MRNSRTHGARHDEELSVLLVHNRYQSPGGEDRVFESERLLLERSGARVRTFELHNDEVHDLTPLQLASRSIWNRETVAHLNELFGDEPSDVVHVHNTLPLISPSVFRAAHQGQAAVVQTLHNYRMICPSATLFRDGRPCELCVRQPLSVSGIVHACYRANRAATAFIATSTFVHRAVGTYSRNVDRFIALTDFARAKLIEGGIPAHQLVVKPNFAEPAPRTRTEPGTYALFIGRLSEEKGVATLLDAWQRHPDLPPLHIAGDGPLRAMVESAAATCINITVLGSIPRDQVQAELQAAAFLVFPSLWYEGFPMTIVEAFSVGVPVVASRLGSVGEIVTEGDVGLTFTPSDADDLAGAVRKLASDPQLNAALGEGAQRRYEDRYTPEANLEQLLRIYDDAMEERQAKSAR